MITRLLPSGYVTTMRSALLLMWQSRPAARRTSASMSPTFSAICRAMSFLVEKIATRRSSCANAVAAMHSATTVDLPYCRGHMPSRLRVRPFQPW